MPGYWKRSVAVATTRRQVLITISQLAAAATLAACARSTDKTAAAAGNSDLELLASVTYDILPYAELPPQSYVNAAQQILDLKNSDVPAGLQKLRDASHGTAWKDVAEAERVKILASMQDSPFFAVIRASTLQALLRDPATFPIVGYGGSSIQFGGYINRGFNDISWLPARKSN
jgi:hypothetical protein